MLMLVATKHLHHPTEDIIGISNPNLHFSLDLYMSCIDASKATYSNIQDSIM